MSSYSVKDKRDYELDQYKKVQKRLKKRAMEHVQKFKREQEDNTQNSFDQLLFNKNPWLKIDTNLKNLINIVINLRGEVIQKRITYTSYTGAEETGVILTLKSLVSTSYFNDIELLKYTLIEINKKYAELFKDIKSQKIPDLKIILDTIKEYLELWKDFYNQL